MKGGNIMDKIDFKITNKELYLPKTVPALITVPAMKFLMVEGVGNPNEENGEYQKAVELLYALSYTIKMTNKKNPGASEEAFYDYVVPPLEGLWWLEDQNDKDFTQKEKYCWYSLIRQPDFITNEMFEQAKAAVVIKKQELDVSKVKLMIYEEGLCVQCMHIGPYSEEKTTIQKIDHYIQSNNLEYNIGNISASGQVLRHHEIYLGDPRKGDPAKMKTVLRHPVRRIE
jgi:hypothetical protein